MNKISENKLEELRDRLTPTQKAVITSVAAGAISGAAASALTAPVVTIGDIMGTQGKDSKSIFYNKKATQVASILYNQGVDKINLKKNAPDIYNELGKKHSIYEKSVPSQLIADLKSAGKYKKDAPKFNQIVGGLREFYGGQGLKILRVAPQNAINFAVFGGVSGYLASLLDSNNNNGKRLSKK